MLIQPYLFFEGRCEEALAFYKTALNAEQVMLMRFADAPGGTPPGAPGDKIMHAALKVGDLLLMLSDGFCQNPPSFSGFSVSLSVKSADEADRVFAALAEGGEVRMPLGATFFSPRFGMLADRFGVPWMVVTDET